MKKVAAILMILAMMFSLFACKPRDDQNLPGSLSDTSSDTVDPFSTNIGSTTIGYWEDDVDHFARKTYEVSYIHNVDAPIHTLMFKCFQNLESYLNIKTTNYYNTTGEASVYLGLFETAIAEGTDGIICDMVYGHHVRIMEMLDEAGVPYIGLFNTARDEESRAVAPTVAMDHYLAGAKQVEFLHEVYREYWGDIDPSEIACMVIANFSNSEFITRQQGIEDKFAELYPENTLVIGDINVALSGGGASYSTGDVVMWHFMPFYPDVKYWFVACVGDYASGAAMWCKQFGRRDTILITGTGPDMPPSEWDNEEYYGNWISNYAVSNYEYAIPAMCGLIAMMDGRADKDTLWQELRTDDDICTRYFADGRMVTRENYKDMEQVVLDKYGIVEH